MLVCVSVCTCVRTNHPSSPSISHLFVGPHIYTAVHCSLEADVVALLCLFVIVWASILLVRLRKLRGIYRMKV